MHEMRVFRKILMTVPRGENTLLNTFLSSKVENLRSKFVDIQAVFFTSGAEESQFDVKYSVVLYRIIKE
jgi:hypothetical protein